MCGIAGVFHYGTTEPVAMADVNRMTSAMIHRGPDADGFYNGGVVGLGMRRLRIIDLCTGDQPIANEDETIWVVFNGEIYNFAELRADLVARGHQFRTQSDTEVIVHLYEEEGDRCVDRFRGMFALALWDTVNEKLVLARDRFGIKPLFVCNQGGRIAFASEMKALFELPWVERSWCAPALGAYLRLGYIPGPLTAYGSVRKFQQGTVETWGKGSRSTHQPLTVRRYWQPAVSGLERATSYEEASHELRNLLMESVRLRLRSDVPLGAFLSGGVDSSTVVALMRACGVADLKTFSIGFEEEGYSELAYARQAADHLATEHYTQVVTGQDAKHLCGVLGRFDEPFGDASAVPTYFVSRLAREHVTVSLSGDGGDELFAGYSQYSELGKYRLVDRLPLPARRLAAVVGSSLISENSRGGGFVRRVGEHTEYRVLSLISDSMTVFEPLLSERFLDFLLANHDDGQWARAFACDNSVSAAQAVDQRNYLADDILVKVDRSSMAVSLEARVPLLDHHLAEFVNRLPEDFKLRAGESKAILKHAVAGDLPEGVLQRPKMGFGVPMRTWLQGPLSGVVDDLVVRDPHSLFDARGIRRLVDDMEKGSRDLSHVVWRLLALAIWAEQQGGRSWA